MQAVQDAIASMNLFDLVIIFRRHLLKKKTRLISSLYYNKFETKKKVYVTESATTNSTPFIQI